MVLSQSAAIFFTKESENESRTLGRSTPSEEAASPVYMSSPFDALEKRARREGTQLFWDFNTENATRSQSAAIFFTKESENESRTLGRSTPSEEAALRKTVRLVDEWIEHPNVTAVIFAHLPGQDSGEAITKIIGK
jgi:beta-glucosidase